MGVPSPGGFAPSRNWIFVFIETDVGITGIGEATTEWHEMAVKAMVEQHFRPMLIGQNPTRITHLWQILRRSFWWRDGVVASSAISGIDQALWDIAGKAYNLPVYKLLGGAVRDRIPLYARVDLGLPGLVEEARAAIDEGLSAFKAGGGPGSFDTGRTSEIGAFDDHALADVALREFTQLREAIGPDIQLMIDCGGWYTQQAAVKLITGLRPLSLLFIEEPVNADTPTGLVELRRTFPDQRIAAGERLCGRWSVREWLERMAVDVLQVDISHTGGITEMIKVAACAEVYNVLMAPHNPYGPVAMAASAHAAAVIPNFLILEYCRLRPWFDKVQHFGPVIKAGHIELDDRPGLGVMLNLDLIEQHPYIPLPVRSNVDRYGAKPLV